MKIKHRIAMALAILGALSLANFEMSDADRAKASCRGEIKRNLKDAATAEFGKAFAVQVDGGGWVVRRELVARNSFGASVASTLYCKVSPDFATVTVQK